MVHKGLSGIGRRSVRTADHSVARYLGGVIITALLGVSGCRAKSGTQTAEESCWGVRHVSGIAAGYCESREVLVIDNCSGQPLVLRGPCIQRGNRDLCEIALVWIRIQHWRSLRQRWVLQEKVRNGALGGTSQALLPVCVPAGGRREFPVPLSLLEATAPKDSCLARLGVVLPNEGAGNDIVWTGAIRIPLPAQ